MENVMRTVKIIAAATLLVGLGFPAVGAEFATKDEAIAMVKKAVALVSEVGPEKAFAEFDLKDGKFTDRDLYVVVYSLSGKVLAHGANAKLIGKDMIDAQDVDGKYYVKERVALAAKKADFWQDYKFVNPVTKKIQPKQMYCHPLNDVAVCAGVYVQ
jgi:cytochrome c